MFLAVSRRFVLSTRILAAGAWFACAALLFAQEYRATLVGVITDQSGAAVPGVHLNLVNLETGVAVASSANEQGRYVVPYLLPGHYKLQVEQAGFRAYERSPIELRINDRIEINVALELGQVSDRVTVVAEAPLLETTT